MHQRDRRACRAEVQVERREQQRPAVPGQWPQEESKESRGEGMWKDRTKGRMLHAATY